MRKRLQSFKYAFQGLIDLFRTQANARLHALATVCVLLAGWYFDISRTEWLIILIFIVVVLAMEALNTALEYLTDLISPTYHPLAGKAKDVAAAAVLIVAVGAAFAAFLIFFPKVSALIQAL